MSSIIVQFILGLLYSNAGEWAMHKYILHALGKHRQSLWAYHLYDHHAVCLIHDMIDPGYQQLSLTTWNTQSKELLVVAVIVLIHAPLLMWWPWFAAAVCSSLALYYYKHRKAHLDPSWAKQHLPWHYDHHLHGQSGNWCVTWPWFDYLLGTRIKNPDH
ncbi:MAG: hypothetical protein ABL925_00565 [Methylococcales bacterium]